jgi:hypothetical protein
MSRSQSQGDYYNRNLYPGQPVRDDRYYHEDSQIPPSRYIPSPQPNILPPVRIHDQSPLGQESPYYPSPRYEPMPPPPSLAHDQSYVRDTYSRSPVQLRMGLPGAPSPLPPPATLPSSSRDVFYDRRPVETRDPRYPAYREGYYERDERDYYRYEDDRYRYDRDRIRQEEEHARERVMTRESDREWREYPDNYPPRVYPPRPRSPGYRGDDYDNWRRMQEADMYERERVERMERDRLERDRLDRERWTRR